MRVWAVANQKGGVGKTTTAISLGGLLAERGERVLLVDLDPHGSLSAYLGHDPETVTPSAYDLFQLAAAGEPVGRLPGLLKPSCVEGMDLLCASTALATVERQLGARPGMGRVVHELLKGLSETYDRVLIDCPPMLGVLVVNALAAAERLIIPVQTEFLALKGLDRMLSSLAMIERSRRDRLPRLIVPTMFDRRTRASVESLRRLRDGHPEALWAHVVPVDTSFREASRAGLPIHRYCAQTRSAETHGLHGYTRLLDSLLEEEAPAPQRRAG
jgi:chromosome partitioning protein